jgi:AmmeMemoRadiSam system protein B
VFYPADPDDLRHTVEGLIKSARRPQSPEGWPKAVIAPHAGYVYSGPVAASAYARLAPARGTVRRVILLGPAHRAPLDTVATSSAGAWATPLGDVGVDVAGRDALLRLEGVCVDDQAHRHEHSLEVQLPFIQTVLGDVDILPIAAGSVAPGLVADALDQVWGGPETCVVLSTDLSHYHDHAAAAQLDRATADAILARQPQDVGGDRACGVFALRGLLVAAVRHHLDVTLLDLRSSGDTAGRRDRVVGYGSFALSEPHAGPP